MRSSPEVVQLLLERQDCNLEMRDAKGVTPLVAALYSGNDEKIEALKVRNVPFPTSLEPEEEEMLQFVVERLERLGEHDKLRLLLKWNNHSPHFEQIVSDYLLNHNPQFLRECIRSGGILNPGGNILKKLYYQTRNNFESYRELMVTCLEKETDLNRYLDQAVFSENKELIKLLLLMGADLSKVSDSQDLFAHIIRFDDLELVKLAHQKGANIQGTFPLQVAAQKLGADSTGEIFKYLLEQGAALNGETSGQPTPLSYVIQSGNLSLVEYSLQHGAEINLEGRDRYLPMEFAALLTNDPNGIIFKKLVEAGGKLNVTGKSNVSTPFATLVGRGNLELIEWALSAGAKVNPDASADKMTPLQKAAARANDPQGLIFKKLLDEGADINAMGTAGEHPVISIIKKGNLELIQWCFNRSVQLDRPPFNEQVLEAAISSGNPEVVQFLEDKGFKILPQTLTDKQLLLKGYQAGGAQMFNKTLDLKADIQSLSDDEKSQLWELIVKENDLPTAKFLLEQLKLSEEEGHAIQSDSLKQGNVEMLQLLHTYMPFYLDTITDSDFRKIVKDEHVDVLKYLIQEGLDINQQMGFDEDTLFTMAVEKVSKKIIRLLLDLKVDPRQRTGEFQPAPIYVAVKTGDAELVKILLDAGAGANRNVKDKVNKKTASQFQAGVIGAKRDADMLRDFFEKEVAFDKVYFFADEAPPIATDFGEPIRFRRRPAAHCGAFCGSGSNKNS